MACCAPSGWQYFLGRRGDIVVLTYDGHKGETVRAAQKPWGSYEAVDTGLVSWGIAALLPVLPLGAAVTAGAFTVREVRRARREATSDELRD
jgi:hypothetical protein